MRAMFAVGILLFAVIGSAEAQSVPMSQDALTKCAEVGVAECQFKLGQLVEAGNGVAKDPEAARKLYELAYKNGYEPASAEILRLARSTATTASKPAELQTLASKDIGPGRPSDSASHETPQPLVSTSVANQASQMTESPATWGIEATKDGPPQVAGIRLGETEADFASAVRNVSCDDKQTLPATRECKGSLADGDVSVEAEFLHGSLYQMTFDARLAPDSCQDLEKILKAKLGKSASHGFASGLISMLMPGSAHVWYNNQWTALNACVANKGTPSDAMLLIGDSQAMSKVKD